MATRNGSVVRQGFCNFPIAGPSRLGCDRQHACAGLSRGCRRPVFICANGGSSPHDYLPCFVNVDTGEIIDRHLPSAVFTTTWRICVLGERHPPRALISYPIGGAHAEVPDR